MTRRRSGGGAPDGAAVSLSSSSSSPPMSERRTYDREHNERFFASGVVAAVVARTAVSPLERLKIIMQCQHLHLGDAAQYERVVPSLRRFWAVEGVRGFFKGNATNCIKVVPTVAIRYVSFENLKRFVLAASATPRDRLTFGEKVVVGGAATFAAISLTYPLDLVRSRLAMQVLPEHTRYRGMLHAFARIAQREGARALYKGYGVTTLTIIPYGALNFAVYETTRELDTRPTSHPVLMSAVYGAVAGVATCCAITVLYPLDLVKRRQMMHRMDVLLTASGGSGGDVPKLSIMSALRSAVATDGVRGLYRGLAPSLLKVVPTMSLTWLTYEACKHHLGV